MVSMELKVGHIVRYKRGSGRVLRCGSGVYGGATVIQVSPLILVSEEADMRWSCLSEEDKADLEIAGEANEATLARAMTRLEE